MTIHLGTEEHPFDHIATDTTLVEDLIEIIVRLRSAYPQVSVGELTDLVGECRSDLSGIPRGAVPELVERLARQRLCVRGIAPMREG